MHHQTMIYMNKMKLKQSNDIIHIYMYLLFNIIIILHVYRGRKKKRNKKTNNRKY